MMIAREKLETINLILKIASFDEIPVFFVRNRSDVPFEWNWYFGPFTT